MTIEQRSSPISFDYDIAFGINYGILSPEEQNRLRRSRVTILGMFVGGTIATMLARSGVAKFVLIDNSRFQMSDMNRDIGCYSDTIGELKAEIAKKQILRINPQASVDVVSDTVSLEGIPKWLDWCDVFCAQSDDLAFSCHAIMLAQQKKKFAITFMPSGMTGYVEVFPPGLKKEVDPAVLFGSPSNLSYRQLYHFLSNPLNRCGRRWQITEGKWHIDWFCDWRDRKAIEPQICPNVWMGASLVSMEIIKFVTGKWRQVKVPRMWHLLTAANKIKVEGYRRRSWVFEKFIYWTFNIELAGFGTRYRRFTTRRLLRELEGMKKQESEGREVKLPFMWRHLI
jgi:molybdopterin/thiamine biosynthesis adenylyltransferase